MRPSQKQNRSRSKNNRKSAGNVVNRVYESAGPDGKVRGTPQQIIDKYQALARDAQTSGDRVAAENYLQHAEHYVRILISAQQTATEQRRDQPQRDGVDEQPQPQAEESFSAEQPAQTNGAGDGLAAAGGENNGLATFDAPPANGAGLVMTAESLNAEPVANAGATPAANGEEPSAPPRRRSSRRPASRRAHRRPSPGRSTPCRHGRGRHA
jgi:hypothetical protein